MEYVDRLLKETEYLDKIREIERLEENRRFCRHGMEHLLSVARIAWLMNLEQGLAADREYIYLCALLHDIGRAEEYQKGTPHEQAGIEMADRILEKIGYPKEKRLAVLKCIGSHRKDKDSIFWQADKQSRNCFCCPAAEECYWKKEQRTTTIKW